MTPERWQQVNALFHTALGYEPALRAAFLTQACAGDEQLLREVESLISAHEQLDSFIEIPPSDLAAEMLAKTQSPLEAGNQISYYKIQSFLGAGGMGEVYMAEDTRLGRRIALKLLPAQFTMDADRVRRFEQEARAASALNHPNILTVHEIGVFQRQQFIATEFIEGETLRQRMRRTGLSLVETLDIAVQLASAFAAAHQAGIVHRDIKPENVMLRPDGYVKVLDFGVAKLIKEETTTARIARPDTEPGVVLGTVKYMSPEQVRSLDVDARTDIFSLGVVLYEMIAGFVPFDGATTGDVIVAILEREPSPLARYLPDAPPELQRVVSKALCKDRAERYQTAKELLIDVKSLRQEIEIEGKLGRKAEKPTNGTDVTTNGTLIVETAKTPGVQTIGVEDDGGTLGDHQKGVFNRLIKVWHANRRFRVLLCADVLLVSLLNPAVLTVFLQILGARPPVWHQPVWAVSLILLLVLSLIEALRTTTYEVRGGLAERRVIKGLRPFTLEDAEIFSCLQRDGNLRECLAEILDSDFRFGILCGESGCGKTSFLQAGLWPQSLVEDHRCVYVRFTDLNPIDSIRQAFNEQLKLTGKTPDKTDLSTLLNLAVEQNTRPLLLLLDQFEQFFVHHKRKSARIEFVQQLAVWYRESASLPVKILVCVRGDFSYRLIELQKAMGYSLGPQQSFRLEKFEPEEAAEIFRVVAEAEGITFDEGFVKEVIVQELAGREDGLVSPVDIQVLAWMISTQRKTEERAFTAIAYRKLGGVEGLLERFLKRALQARETESRRQIAIKCLLALTDLERNTRAGELDLTDLKKKMAGTVPPGEIEEALAWLVRSDVRLVTPVERNGTQAYELAHERLIVALRRLAGQELSAADRANQLLDRRVNEWIGNNHNSRYRLTWREIRLIERERAFLTWGSLRSQKEALLSKSRRRLRFNAGAVILTAILILAFSVWWYSAAGIIWQVERDLVTLSDITNEPQSLWQAAEAFASVRRFDRAHQIATRIRDSHYKIRALTSIAEAYARAGATTKAAGLMEEASDVGEQVSPSILCEIAGGYGRIGDLTKAAELLGEAHKLAAALIPGENVWVFERIAEGYAGIGDRSTAITVLEQECKIVEMLGLGSKAYLFPSIAQAYMRIGERSKAIDFVNQAYADAKASDPNHKSATLQLVAKAYAVLGAATMSADLLEQALDVAEMLSEPPAKSTVLSAVAEGYANLGELATAAEFLEQALNLARTDKAGSRFVGIPDWVMTANAVRTLAEHYARAGRFKKAAELLDQTYKDLEGSSAFHKPRVLATLAPAYAQIGDWRRAYEIATRAGDDQSKTVVLSGILKAWAGQGRLTSRNRGE